MRAIYEKEIKAYFFTMQAYVFISVFLAVTGYLFAMNVIDNRGDVSVMLDNTVVSFVFLIPVLTMRLFAEEKHLKTDKLYMAAPIPSYKIVLGKYFAALTVFLIAAVLSGTAAAALTILSGGSAAETLCVYTGFVLLGAVFIAVGMFVSAMTENQIVACIISFGVCLFMYIADWLLDFGANAAVTAVVKLAAITVWYENFLVGVFDIRAAVYLITLALVFVFFTYIKLESTRWKQ